MEGLSEEFLTQLVGSLQTRIRVTGESTADEHLYFAIDGHVEPLDPDEHRQIVASPTKAFFASTPNASAVVLGIPPRAGSAVGYTEVLEIHYSHFNSTLQDYPYVHYNLKLARIFF